MQSVISKWIPEEKVFEFDSAADCLNILRRAGSQKQRNVFYRNKRPHLLAEKFSFKSDGVCLTIILKMILLCDSTHSMQLNNSHLIRILLTLGLSQLPDIYGARYFRLIV